ncbi:MULTISPECIES: glycosyltransferase family 2 protein [Providencia]|uniref:glycosyltransferase family 2 protein n=1 Tax=Providencia TaxID=586 RepID=UPI00234A846B|nr:MULTISPECIES: glycosyltransferase family 2 protein [unclassified Providencia]
MVTFSYIIPTYNRYKELKETVQSVLNQCTDIEFEVIIVDDGSTDDTLHIKDYFNDPRIKYFYQENSGVSIARNTGYKYSNGIFVIFLDSDDLVTKNQLAIFSKYIQKEPCFDIYLTSYCYWNSSNQQQKPRKNIKQGEYKNFFSDFIAGVQPCFSGCLCIRRNILSNRDYIFEPGCNFGEDQKLWIDIFQNYKVFSSSEITMLYRVNSEESLSKRKIKKLPPDIKYSHGMHSYNSELYCLHRLTTFTILSIKNLSLSLLSEIITFCIKNKIVLKYLKTLYMYIKNKYLLHGKK